LTEADDAAMEAELDDMLAAIEPSGPADGALPMPFRCCVNLLRPQLAARRLTGVY